MVIRLILKEQKIQHFVLCEILYNNIKWCWKEGFEFVFKIWNHKSSCGFLMNPICIINLSFYLLCHNWKLDEKFICIQKMVFYISYAYGSRHIMPVYM